MPPKKIADLIPDSWKLAFLIACIMLTITAVIYAFGFVTHFVARYTNDFIGDLAGVMIVFVFLYFVYRDEE